jgi:hypothetical protein
MRTLRSFLAGAITAAKKKAIKKAIKKGLLVKTKRKAVKNAIVTTVMAQNQNINTPVAPSNMGGLGIRQRRQTKLNVTKRRH